MVLFTKEFYDKGDLSHLVELTKFSIVKCLEEKKLHQTKKLIYELSKFVDYVSSKINENEQKCIDIIVKEQNVCTQSKIINYGQGNKKVYFDFESKDIKKIQKKLLKSKVEIKKLKEKVNLEYDDLLKSTQVKIYLDSIKRFIHGDDVFFGRGDFIIEFDGCSTYQKFYIEEFEKDYGLILEKERTEFFDEIAYDEKTAIKYAPCLNTDTVIVRPKNKNRYDADIDTLIRVAAEKYTYFYVQKLKKSQS